MESCSLWERIGSQKEVNTPICSDALLESIAVDVEVLMKPATDQRIKVGVAAVIEFANHQ
jgi:hypothetical protein